MNLSEKLGDIRKLTNVDLVAKTQSLAGADRLTRVSLIWHLQVVMERNIHLSYGNSLRKYCHQVLKMSWGAAGHYDVVCREILLHPELCKRIEEGKLHISTISRIGSFFRDQERKNNLRVGLGLRKKIYNDCQGKSRDEIDRMLFRVLDEQGIKRDRKEHNRVVSEHETLMELIADDELVEFLEEMRMFLSHQPEMSTQAAIVKLAVKDWLHRHHPKYRKNNDALRGHGGRAASQDSRVAGKKVRDQIWPDDPSKEGCSYVDPDTSIRCGSKFQLQADHREPFATGGKTTSENLRWLCGAHNRFLAEKAGLARPPPISKKSAS